MRKLMTLAATLLCSTTVLANSGNTVFSCTTTNGKPLTVKKSGGNYLLSYDKLSVNNPINRVMENDNTVLASRSGYILYSLNFKDSQVEYYVQMRESMGDGKMLYGGLFLVKGNDDPKEMAKCNTRKPFKANFDIALMPQRGTGY